MRTFAQKPKTTQPSTSAKPSTVIRANIAQGHDPNSILNLQRTMGNQTLQWLLQSDPEQRSAVLPRTASPHLGVSFSWIQVTPLTAQVIQTKLVINTPGDEYEQEADRVADQVMRMPYSKVQRACACGGECPKCRKEQSDQQRLRTMIAHGHDVEETTVSPVAQETVSSPGQSLDSTAREFMEPRFGHDFSQVRVHTDANAAELARIVGAQAFTVGPHVVFGPNQYAPATSEGRRLLAHELAHVIQQRNGRIGFNMPAIQRRTYRYCREVETGNEVMDTFAGVLDLEHCWLKTDTKAAGMGPAEEGPLPAWPFGIPTMIRDHSQDAHTDSTEIHCVDENCVNQELEIGKSTGAWGVSNNCNTFVDDVVERCRERRSQLDRQFVRSGSFGIESVGSAGPVNISAGNTPYFRVRPLPEDHCLRFRWVIADDQDRRYLMWGTQGSVFQYGSQYTGYIPTGTRALLRERNIRTATILCRVLGGEVDRLTRFFVRFVW